MAAKRQKNTVRKRGPAKKKTSSKNSGKKTVRLTKEEQIKKDDMKSEILVLILFAITLFLIFSNIGIKDFNLCGSVGKEVSYVMFGSFGFMAFLFPIAFSFAILFAFVNRRNRLMKFKLAGMIGLFLSLCMTLDLVCNPFADTEKLRQVFHLSASMKTGGGVLGFFFVQLLKGPLGSTGVVLFNIFAICISLVLVSNKQIFRIFLKRVKHVCGEKSDHVKKIHEQKRLNRIQMAEEAEKNEYDGDSISQEKPKNFDLSIRAKNVEKCQQEDDKVKKSKKLRKKELDEVPTIMDAPIGGDMIIEEEVISPNPVVEPIPVNHMEPIKADGDLSTLGSKNDVHGEMKPIEISEKPSAMEELIFEQPLEIPKEPISEVTPIESVPDGIEPLPVKQEQKKVEKATEEEKKETAENIETALEQKKEYTIPPLDLLVPGKHDCKTNDDELRQTAMKLQSTLESFGVKVQVTNVSCGPSVTRYELQPDQGVKVSKILNLADDIKLNLAVSDIRIEAPIPGKAAVGIEVPNKENVPVLLRDLFESREFKTHKALISFAVGRDIGGKVIMADIAKMPHLLIAGATGSGKSVCINTLIMSIIYKLKPEDVRMIMIDPKVVELSVYNGIPHLLIPVVTDPKKAAGALNWAVMEMTDRYKKFAEINVRDLKGYNAKVKQAGGESETYPLLPQIVIIIDELADLMMVASAEVEDAICRLAQLARACGIHLVIATQRPSVNVITGLIKANIPSRIAFSVSSGVDSRTIIDMVGAEKLLGKGDMLFYPSGYQKPLRVQGAFISDSEVNDVVEYIKECQDHEVYYNEEITSKITSTSQNEGLPGQERDEYFLEAAKYIIEKDKTSIGMLQRVFRIGFNRASRLMSQLEDAGIVGPEEGTKPRKVVMSKEEFENYVEESL